MKNPNLFIVGAPKCGTTFLYHYLKKHPDIYFPDFKEPHFFGGDLNRRNGAYNLSLNEYKNLFKTDKKVVGEASTLYLFSKKSAEEIYNFNPQCKIIIMLRDLAEAIYLILHKTEPGSTYNAGTKEPISMKEIVKRISMNLDINFDDFVEITEGRQHEDAVYWLDSSKLQKETGWQAKISIDSGIQETREWVENNLDELALADFKFHLRA